MPSFNEIRDSIKANGSTYDIFRKEYVEQLSEHTGRNTIIYYSGWLQKTNIAPLLTISDDDKNGFMTAIHGLDRSRGLDLILHTPGGDVSATESLIDYLRKMFGTDIRAIIPQMAMSGGTMMACACKEILMGKQSSLGPIDPQIAGVPAIGIRDEFERAMKEIKDDKDKIPIWQPILAKYTPTLIGQCVRAINWSTEIASDSLLTGMFVDNGDKDEIVKKIVHKLTDNDETKSHNRQFSATKCKELGLKVSMIEDDPELQDIVLSIHHASILTITSTAAAKIIENNQGKSHIIQYNPPPPNQ